MRRFWWVPMAMTIALGVVGAASERAVADVVELGDCVPAEMADLDASDIAVALRTAPTAAPDPTCTSQP